MLDHPSFEQFLIDHLYLNQHSIPHLYYISTAIMDKLKSMFGGKHDNSSAAQSASHTTTSSGNGANAEGVTLHTTLGDITIALFKDQTPKVSFNGIASRQYQQ
jgi:peptidyl-prolyl cis-trans isomerase-like 1